MGAFMRRLLGSTPLCSCVEPAEFVSATWSLGGVCHVCSIRAASVACFAHAFAQRANQDREVLLLHAHILHALFAGVSGGWMVAPPPNLVSPATSRAYQETPAKVIERNDQESRKHHLQICRGNHPIDGFQGHEGYID